MNVTPVPLTGRHVRLEPLTEAHVEPLARVGLAPELWRLQPTVIATPGDMRTYVQRALDEQARGTGLPFAIMATSSGAVIGSTRYMDIAPAHRRLEIGATWITSTQQRTGANTVVSIDSSCLMQIQGALSRAGSPVRTLHLAEVLASR